MMSSTMIGGFGVLFRAFVSMSLAREVSAMSGDQLKLNAMFNAMMVWLVTYIQCLSL